MPESISAKQIKSLSAKSKAKIFRPDERKYVVKTKPAGNRAGGCSETEIHLQTARLIGQRLIQPTSARK